MPLVRSWWLGKKKGKEAWVRPIIVADAGHPSGKRVEFEIGHGLAGAPSGDEDGTVGRSGGDVRRVRVGGGAGLHPSGRPSGAARGASHGSRRRGRPAARVPAAELTSTGAAAMVGEPDERAGGEHCPTNPRDFKTPNYGMTQLGGPLHEPPAAGPDDLQRPRHRRPASACSATPSRPAHLAGDRLESGGTDAEAYADAVATYLGIAVESTTPTTRTRCARWRSDTGNESVGDLFARQAIPMTWDFAEGIPAQRVGQEGSCVRECGVASVVDRLRADARSDARQADASHAVRLDGGADLHRPAVLRQHRLLRPLGLLLRVAAPLAARHPSGPAEHDARPEGRGARRQPVPPRRQGGREGVLRGRLPACVRARARDRAATTSRSPSTTRSSSPTRATTGPPRPAGRRCSTG